MSNELNVIRGNPNVKASNVTEHVTIDEYQYRVQEIIRCKKDPIYFANKYFTIVTMDEGKQIIKLYPKQEQLIKTMVQKDRICCLAARQSGKSTAYNIFVLWTAMFNKDKNILICANKERTALEFIQRIKLAYELIPNWLKPGIKPDGWNKRDIKFSNGSSISGLATSSDSARGQSCNILILDEFGFVDGNIADDFWQSVYPVISSGKKTKVIMVSTPNGAQGLFYETYERATLGIDDDGWTPFKIDWWEVPGRDEAWKRKTIASMNNDMRKFNQEFGNVFHGSSYTLIPGNKLKQYREFGENNKKTFEEIYLDDHQLYKLKIWEKPQKDRTYIIGGDVGEGIGKDYSVSLVFDITDTTNIKLVASFADNMIGQINFAYVLAKIGSMYNKAFIACENNGISSATIETLWMVFEYENIISHGTKDGSKIGIHSHNSIKINACFWLRDLMNQDFFNFELNEKELIYEMGWFERKVPSHLTIYQAVNGKNDDYMIAFIWAMYCLTPSIVENYFIVERSFTTHEGIELPHIIKNFTNSFYDENSTNTNMLPDFGDSSEYDIDKKYRQLLNPDNNINNNDSEFSQFGFASDIDDQSDGWMTL